MIYSFVDISIFIHLKQFIFYLTVVRQPYDIRVEGNDVFLGNVAFLRCFIPEHVRKYVTVTSWFRGDEELLAELAYMGKFNYPKIMTKKQKLNLKNRMFQLTQTHDTIKNKIKNNNNIKIFNSVYEVYDM